MNSAEIARVREMTPVRTFIVENDNGETSIVDWSSRGGDTLFCHRHLTYDDCTCTARVRLCGILTNTVVRVRPAKAEARA
jgi:hypothetical protein